MSFTGSRFSSESAPKPFHHGIRERGRTIFQAALSSVRTAGSSGHANLPHPSSREDIFPLLGGSRVFLLSGLIMNGFHAAATVGSWVDRNSVPSIHMRCRMASRRASATIAFFIPRRLAICMAQALSQDHFFQLNML